MITAWVRWAWVRLGYVVRPYDMLADRRRWFWQDPQRCGWFADRPASHAVAHGEGLPCPCFGGTDD